MLILRNTVKKLIRGYQILNTVNLPPVIIQARKGQFQPLPTSAEMEKEQAEVEKTRNQNEKRNRQR